jgi:hypothetical protein
MRTGKMKVRTEYLIHTTIQTTDGLRVRLQYPTFSISLLFHTRCKYGQLRWKPKTDWVKGQVLIPEFQNLCSSIQTVNMEWEARKLEAKNRLG